MSNSTDFIFPEPLNPSQPDLVDFYSALVAPDGDSIAYMANAFFYSDMDKKIATPIKGDPRKHDHDRITLTSDLEVAFYDYRRGGSGKDGKEPPPSKNDLIEKIKALQTRFGAERGTAYAGVALEIGEMTLQAAIDKKLGRPAPELALMTPRLSLNEAGEGDIFNPKALVM